MRKQNFMATTATVRTAIFPLAVAGSGGSFSKYPGRALNRYLFKFSKKRFRLRVKHTGTTSLKLPRDYCSVHSDPKIKRRKDVDTFRFTNQIEHDVYSLKLRTLLIHVRSLAWHRLLACELPEEFTEVREQTRSAQGWSTSAIVFGSVKACPLR